MQRINTIIFDLDGVLLSSKQWHFETLNSALATIDSKYTLSLEEHLEKYDGKPTTVKLEQLHKEKGLPRECFEIVWQRKQEAVRAIIQEEVQPSSKLVKLLDHFQKRGYIIMCCTNTTRLTLDLILQKLGIWGFFSHTFANDDPELKDRFPLFQTKPSPCIYMYACLKAGVTPRQTLVLEDSPVGRQAALDAGCCLFPVVDPEHVTQELITHYIDWFNARAPCCITCEPRAPFLRKDLNVLLPMAGLGSRFVKAGYQDIKPMIEVKVSPTKTRKMIEIVCNNLSLAANHIFIVQKHHMNRYCWDKWLPSLIPWATNTTVVPIEGLTRGACCTALLAKEHIDQDKPLLIVNSDQYIEGDIHQFLHLVLNKYPGLDGGIVTFEQKKPDPKWSYALTDPKTGLIQQVAEKKVISQEATVGMYLWKKGSDFVHYAQKFISNDANLINNEFYICPVYQLAINDGGRFVTWDAGKMHGLGVPEDLQAFEQLTCPC